MKDKLIKQYNLKHTASTKWNEIFESDTHVFIYNVVTGIIKIKPKVK